MTGKLLFFSFLVIFEIEFIIIDYKVMKNPHNVY
jgi:hypothetical protein